MMESAKVKLRAMLWHRSLEHEFWISVELLNKNRTMASASEVRVMSIGLMLLMIMSSSAGFPHDHGLFLLLE